MNDVIADGVDGGTGGVACRLSVRDKARRFDSIANRNSLSEWNLCNTGIHHRDPVDIDFFPCSSYVVPRMVLCMKLFFYGQTPIFDIRNRCKQNQF